ncbi:Ferredoxin-type protein NapF [Candidatus Lokiarchaeum ossiferum]|uniref:Ferredoxin-type protein NapF n=1 Tax=Candidatus Lokiarchaeum ossiferum TaxID=2951803 RepID=A0ABY6HVC3_9ARCH|nr:Ferredoxin-type protein NapF [Candidatus Lokiarchaeum sp. B-35]
MRGIIFYYSGSGNTKLACNYLVHKLNSKIDFELFNMAKYDTIPDLDNFKIIGFATFTNFWLPSHLVMQFVENIAEQSNKPAFILSTHGFTSGNTLKSLAKAIKKRGFRTIASFALHLPENYPPMIKRGQSYENSPNSQELTKFDAFISELKLILSTHPTMENFPAAKVRTNLITTILSKILRLSTETAKKDMGEKYVDLEKCTKCGICEKGCPYGAITLSPNPQFDEEKCFGCWFCYNHCPTTAISTKKICGPYQYAKPSNLLREKFRI